MISDKLKKEFVAQTINKYIFSVLAKINLCCHKDNRGVFIRILLQL